MNFMYNFCNDQMAPIANLLKIVIELVQFGIPILLVIFGIIDLGKAVMASKEDEMKKAQGTLIKRVIYAIAIFLVVFVVRLVMDVISDAGAETEPGWYECIFERADDDDNSAENQSRS